MGFLECIFWMQKFLPKFVLCSQMAHKRWMLLLWRKLPDITKIKISTCQITDCQTSLTRDGLKERGALGHISFRGPTQVWPIWSFIWKAWKYGRFVGSAPSKVYHLWFGVWFCDCLRSSIEIKDFPTFFSKPNNNAFFSWNL